MATPSSSVSGSVAPSAAIGSETVRPSSQACHALVVTTTERCNSNCVYCSKVTRRPRDMSLQVVAELLRAVDAYLGARSGESLGLLWHGGEPLWLESRYFEAVADLQRRLCASTQHRIEHRVQTNLTCLSAAHLSALRRLGVADVGTSFDPEPGIRGPGKRVDSNRYNRQFLQGLRLVERSGLGWGLIYVVTQRSLERPREVFHFLTNLNLASRVTLNPVLSGSDRARSLAITPREYVDFLGTIYPCWHRRRHRFPSVHPLVAWERALAPGDDGASADVRDGSVQLSVHPDGTVSPCLPDRTPGARSYGRIGDRTLAELFEAHWQWQRQAERHRHASPLCHDCRWWPTCRGGLDLDAAAHTDMDMQESGWCDARRRFFTEYYEPVHERGRSGA